MIYADNLSFSHKQFQILKEIDFRIENGELVSIIGPNGAGKSTLMSLLACENTSCNDCVYFKNKMLSQWKSGDLACHKAKFSQENNSDIGLLVEDIVLMGRYPYFKSIPSLQDREAVASAMRATDVRALRSRKYNTLSGGEKQRVHLARVLAQLETPLAHKLAFFDEPLNNLDVKYQYQILKSIQEFTAQGNSAIMVLHDLNLASAFSDSILLLKNGEVVAYGKPEKVLTESIITKTYDFPCSVFTHPLTKKPMIIFGEEKKEHILNYS